MQTFKHHNDQGTWAELTIAELQRGTPAHCAGERAYQRMRLRAALAWALLLAGCTLVCLGLFGLL